MPDTFSSPITNMVDEHDTAEGAVLRLFGSWRPCARLTVPIAERVRFALMRACSRQVPWQLSGKDTSGRPLVGHEHLFFLPIGRGGDGAEASIEHVLVWARQRLEAETRDVLASLGDCGGWLRIGSRSTLRFEIVALGGPSLLTMSLRPATFGPAQTWRSATPFVPPRHCKRRGGQLVDAHELQLAKLAELACGVQPKSMERLEHGDWRGYQQRRGQTLPGAAGWTLHFPQPVRGPIVLGAGAHYGLGRFEAVTR